MLKYVLISVIIGLIFIAGCNIPHVDPIRTPRDPSQCGSKIICKDGSQHEAWNLVDGKCFQINYIRDPCGELPSGRVMELTPEICRQAGGNWNECGSPCAGTDAEFCIQVCQAQCECGGIAGFTCPVGYDCRLSGKTADEIGVCIPKANV